MDNVELDLSELDNSIWKYYNENRMEPTDTERRIDIVNALAFAFRAAFPRSELRMFGSSITGLSTKNADMDLCLETKSNLAHHRKIIVLRKFRAAARRYGLISNMLVIPARIPIIKFQFTYPISGGNDLKFDCDINIDNTGGCRNSHLLRGYVLTDRRVAPLIIYVKKWAKANNMNDASSGTFSSYALGLMVISFLQVQCEPPVVPCLQRDCPAIFDEKRDLFELDADIHRMQRIVDGLGWKSQNSMSLGDLFFNFVKYYSSFDYRRIISVRLGGVFGNDAEEMKKYSELTKNRVVNVEDPIEFSNVCRAIANYPKRDAFVRTLLYTRDSLVDNKNDSDLVGRKSNYQSGTVEVLE